jgi:hypothetical protein
MDTGQWFHFLQQKVAFHKKFFLSIKQKRVSLISTAANVYMSYGTNKK